MEKRRVFSGARPSGQLHLGNYLGAVKGYIDLQEKKGFDCIYSVVDLHGITTPYEPKHFQKNVYGVVLDFLGAGLDPKKCHLMIQSEVPEHVELAYLLGTFVRVSRLRRLPPYREKIKKGNEPNVGLLYYPILMAADILIYKAELVPIGEDQGYHVEVAREIAKKFNNDFANIFPEPHRYPTPEGYVPSLSGDGKMSKSIKGSCIFLTDNLKTIREKLARVPTDEGKGKQIPTGKKGGGVFALLTFTEQFLGKEEREKYEKQYLTSGIKYSELKEKLALAIHKQLEPIQEKRKYYEQHPQEVKKILEEGRKYCSKIAKETLREAKKAMGLV